METIKCKMWLGFSAVLLLAAAYVVDARKGYILTAPKVFLAGAKENVCIKLHDVSSDFSLEFKITSSDQSKVYLAKSLQSRATRSRSRSSSNSIKRCWDLAIPEMPEPVRRALFIVSGQDRSGYSFNDSKPIGIQHKSIMVFIQTDKSIYKPGQDVKIRTLTLTYDMKPFPDPIDLLYVENPTQTRMNQWEDVYPNHGILDFEMALSKDPLLGIWKITAEIKGTKYVKTFEVKEYVLPKFEIVVKPQPYLLWNDDEIKGEICAKYTYGKPVEGQLKLNVCIEYGNYNLRRDGRSQHCYVETKPIKGCGPYVFSRRSDDMSISYGYTYGNKIRVVAEVTETATGIVLNETNDATMFATAPLSLEFESPNYFKPGLSYYGRVSVSNPDGSAAAGEIIQLTLSANGHTIYVRSYTADAAGAIDFGLPNMPRGVFQVSLLAQAVHRKDKNDNFPSSRLSIKSWYSRNGRFMQIEPVYRTVIPGGIVFLNVTFTTKQPDSYQFYYEVQTLGNIVASGSKYHEVSSRSGMQGPSAGSAEPNGEAGSQGRQRRGLAGPSGPAGPAGPARPPTPVTTTPAPPPLPHEDSYILKLAVKPNMSPKARLVMYYITDDGEVVADSIEFNVQELLDHQVTMEFSDSQRLPGETTTLKIKADANSICAYGVVDKSVHLLGGNGQLKMSDVFSKLRFYTVSKYAGPYFYNPYCSKIRGETTRPEYYGRGYYTYYTTVDNYLDSKVAFENMGMLVMSDLDVESRPCWREKRYDYWWGGYGPRGMPGVPGPAGPAVPAGPVGPAGPEGGPEAAATTTTPATGTKLGNDEKPVVELRNYFPETWLWNLRLTGRSKEIRIPQTLPHTITEWVGSAFCTNWKTGLGVSPTATIRAFQPFFVSFTLPYSVVRGERVHLPVTVFNYLTECLVIKLEMKDSTDYSVIGDKITHLCVCGSESKTHTYEIVFSEIGKTNVSVQGVSVTATGVCGDNQVISKKIGARDAVSRQLLVEPEGREEDYSFNDFICVEDGDEQIQMTQLTLPNNLVPDSARADVSVIGNVLGPTLSGLDKLLHLPTGCGEQNMVSFAPDIYILQYLTNTNQLSDEVEKTALHYLKTGYQRELTYKHTDGSYSAFGNSDKEGSTWLTAFVVKCFGQAKPYIFIDPKNLEQSINWFKGIQDRNGCFEKKGKVSNRGLKGGSNNGATSPVTLTSFVLISLMEAGVSKTDPLVTNAIRCLDGYTGSDTYTVTTMAYAYSLWNRASPQRAEIMTKLDNLAITDDGLKHWSRTPGAVTTTPPVYSWRWHYRAPSADVEMTSYALLANMVGAATSTVGDIVPIVKWISKQRNSYGGFASTQDTVVALQALAQFADLTYGDGIEVEVEVDGQNVDHRFEITDSNALVLQREEITVPNNLTFRVVGQGCALVQANVRYNVLEMNSRQAAFQMNVSTSINNTNCNEAYISICTRYTGPGENSDMAVVSVKMVSGWGAAKNSLEKLSQDKSLDLKKFEFDLNKVNFYFDELTNNAKCFRFRVKKYMLITNTKPANIEVYDYYDTDLSTNMDYSIPDCQ